MNERIKQLWLQAGGNFDRGNQYNWPQYTINDPAKFAELIVRECAQVASNQVMDVEGNDWGVRRAVETHFGVEE